VNANARKLKKHSFLEVEVVYYEVGSALSSDEKVGCKPTGKGLCVVVVDKTEYALLVAEVGVGGLVTANVAVTAADNRGYDLVANLDRLACSVSLNVLTESDDLARALVTESYRNESEGIRAPLVYVGTANATALYLDENVVILKLRNGELLNLDLLLSGKHSNLRSLGNTGRRLRRCCGLAENSAYYCFYLRRRNIHFIYLS
jgi:hypothetical protein